jgi:hypothetical protein
VWEEFKSPHLIEGLTYLGGSVQQIARAMNQGLRRKAGAGFKIHPKELGHVTTRLLGNTCVERGAEVPA